MVLAVLPPTMPLSLLRKCNGKIGCMKEERRRIFPGWFTMRLSHGRSREGRRVTHLPTSHAQTTKLQTFSAGRILFSQVFQNKAAHFFLSLRLTSTASNFPRKNSVIYPEEMEHLLLSAPLKFLRFLAGKVKPGSKADGREGLSEGGTGDFWGRKLLLVNAVTVPKSEKANVLFYLFYFFVQNVHRKSCTAFAV